VIPIEDLLNWRDVTGVWDCSGNGNRTTLRNDSEPRGSIQQIKIAFGEVNAAVLDSNSFFS